MKYAADFRSIARNALRGKWAIAVVAGLLAALLGGIVYEGPEISLHINDSDISLLLEVAGQEIDLLSGEIRQLTGVLAGAMSLILSSALISAVICCVLGSVIEVGYFRFNLDMVDGQKTAEIGRLFSYFSYWQTTTVSRLLRWVYTFLWSLLFVIPGIMASYSYAMTGYILAEHPELTAGEAIARSKEMMYGNRWRLFCLQLSFIGWELLSALVFGIGELWLRPYKQAATAAFYREVSGTAQLLQSVEE